MTRRLATLYSLNAALLATHEVDAAYWREWEFFGLPGGSPLFVAVHVPLFLGAFLGLGLIVRERPAGRFFAWAVAVAGLAAAIIHGGFWAGGDLRMREPVSMSLVGASALVSVAQIVVVRRWRDGRRNSAETPARDAKGYGA